MKKSIKKLETWRTKTTKKHTSGGVIENLKLVAATADSKKKTGFKPMQGLFKSHHWSSAGGLTLTDLPYRFHAALSALRKLQAARLQEWISTTTSDVLAMNNVWDFFLGSDGERICFSIRKTSQLIFLSLCFPQVFDALCADKNELFRLSLAVMIMC